MIPDDSAGRPLTPGEQAVIADLERRFLLDSAVPVRERVAIRTAGGGSTARPRSAGAPQAVLPLLVLLAAGLALVAAAVLVGGGPLGVAAVLVSVVATALAWPLIPASLGGPVRPPRQPYRSRRAARRRP